MKCEVKQLFECPQHMETVGNWIFHEWWSKRHDSAEVVFTWLRTHTQKDKVPFTVVALADGTPVGSCSVIENDCVFRKQYTPWVAAVFVKPEMRHRGIASAALQEAAAIAVRAQVKGLYIDCLAVTAPVYEKNGWRVYEREVGDKDSVVMLRTIEDRSRRAEHGAPLNGGPAIRPDTSGVSGGPPSVS
jgi:GNAT superfamily N-acetyltransferase